MMKRIVGCMIFLIGTSILQVNGQDIEDRVISEAELPEGMRENVDSLYREWSRWIELSADESSIGQGTNPYFEQAVYIDRLRRIPSIVDLAYNNVVEQYIEQYTGKLRSSVAYMLGVMNFYVPMFEEALLSYNVPLELKYLPIIESALNPKARSRAGAVGLWQFMIDTSKQYGLEVNSLVDERQDPIKSSYAAAHYLRDLYAEFGDWTLAIAAYNCGPTNIEKAIHRAGGERDYWKIYPYLPLETRGYVPAFIAATYVMNYYREHNITPLKVTITAATDTVKLEQDVTMEMVASVCDISMDELRLLNPQYKTNLMPGYRMDCAMRLPEDKILHFIDNQDSIYSQSPTAQAIVVPDEKITTTSPKKSSTSSKKYITVRRGQTLGQIARTYRTTVKRLKQLNGLRSNTIRAGSRLRVR